MGHHAIAEVTSPRHLFSAAHTVLEVLESTEAMWPGLQQAAPDVGGHVVVHYGAARGSDDAAHITSTHGVLTAWQGAMPNARHQRDDTNDAECHTLWGSIHGCPVTVLATICGGSHDQ